MDTIKINKGKCKIIAHRGLSEIEPENTMAAFIAAANRSYFAIESDVHKTIDGYYVMIHDKTTGRVADKNLSVADSKLSELRALSIFDRDHSTRIDLKITTLQEYLGICRRYHKIGILELKDIFSVNDIKDILYIIQEEYDLKYIVFISFHLDNLIQVRKQFPQACVQLLSTIWSENLFEILVENRFDLAIDYHFLTQEVLEKAKANHFLINTWTCNDSHDARTLVEWGVDFITSDILE